MDVEANNNPANETREDLSGPTSQGTFNPIGYIFVNFHGSVKKTVLIIVFLFQILC
jgi:hypothetical protein